MKIAYTGLFLPLLAVIIFMPGCFPKQQNSRKNTHTRVTVDKEVYAPCVGVTIAYPVLKDLPDTTLQTAINNRLHEIFIGGPDSFNEFHEGENDECPSTYTCDFTSKQHNCIITITESGTIYEGGAHGMPFNEVFYIDVRTGKFFHLADLLKQKSDLRVLTGLIQDRYQEQKEEIGGFDDVINCLSEDQSFIMSADGLEIYFRPYEIACYAAGFPSFTLSWQELEDLIDVKSDFYMAYFA